MDEVGFFPFQLSPVLFQVGESSLRPRFARVAQRGTVLLIAPFTKGNFEICVSYACFRDGLLGQLALIRRIVSRKGVAKSERLLVVVKRLPEVFPSDS
jgi:hypothetical protein